MSLKLGQLETEWVTNSLKLVVEMEYLYPGFNELGRNEIM